MKKVFIGVLAALMLFAFTACEPQQMDWPYMGDDAKDVASIELVTPSDVKFYAGLGATDNKAVDTSVNLNRLDGTVTKNVIAKITPPTTVVPGRNTATVEWNATGTNKGQVFVDAQVLESLELVLEETEDLADKDAISVESVWGVYSDGYRADFTAAFEYATYDAESGTATVKVVAGPYSTVDVVSNAVPVTLKETPAEPEYITASQATGIELVWYVNGTKADVTGNNITVKVGDKVAYQVRGTKEGTAGCALTTANYDVSGTAIALTNIDDVAQGYTMLATNITDEETEAYTLHVQFKGVQGSENYDERWTLDATITVVDTLTQANTENAEFYFNPTKGEDGAFTGNGTLAAGVAHNFTTNEFKAQVKTADQKVVELVADALRGKVNYAANEIVNGQAITIEFHWVATGYPEIQGYDSVTITPATVASDN